METHAGLIWAVWLILLGVTLLLDDRRHRSSRIPAPGSRGRATADQVSAMERLDDLWLAIERLRLNAEILGFDGEQRRALQELVEEMRDDWVKKHETLELWLRQTRGERGDRD